MKKLLALSILCASLTTQALFYRTYTDTYTPNPTTTHTITYYYTKDYSRLIKTKKCTRIISTGDVFKSCKVTYKK